jgi:hypothetical protein
MMPRALAVFGAALVVLAWDIGHDGIAAPYLDPISHMRTQDEAVQAACALRMAHIGGWATPVFLGRLFLFKPPMLLWLAGGSIRILGMSLLAIRLPALLLGAAGVAAVFLWCARAGSTTAGVLASGLLLLSPFWQMFSRVCLTDVPAAAFAAIALAGAALDPRLEHRRTVMLFGAAAGASILTKSIVGVLPVAALGMYCVLAGRELRPPFSGLLATGLVLASVVIPWHLYQAVVHPQWFWADYVQVQLLGVGLRSQTNAVTARSSVFYVDRFLRMDPVLAVLGVGGLAAAMARWHKLRNQPGALLAFCGLVAAAGALCVFQAKHLPYIVYVLPCLSVLAALGAPPLLRRPAGTVSLLAVLFAAKVIAGGAVWSLRPASPPIEGAQAMREYAKLGRHRELIAAQPDDEFYSATLPLPRLRYCFLDPAGAVAATIPYYPMLGIVLDAQQFSVMPGLLPAYRERLHRWGLDSSEPVGTVIVLRAAGEIAQVAQAAPAADLYLPSEWAGLIPELARLYDVVKEPGGRVLLLRR